MALVLPACEGEFLTDPTRPRPTRAVQNPYDVSSGNNEVMNASTGAIPIVSVDFSNKKDEPPKVTTILDPMRGPHPIGAPTSRPAPVEPSATTQPQADVAPAQPVEAQQVRVVAQRKPEDSLALSADNEGNVWLTVTCPSAAGGVTLARTGDIWPAVIHVTLQKAPNKPFSDLQQLTAGEITVSGRRIDLKATTQPSLGRADITIPGFSRSPRIAIEWLETEH